VMEERRTAELMSDFDDYDIGSKDQKGSIATRFGTRESLQRAVATDRSRPESTEKEREDKKRPSLHRKPASESHERESDDGRSAARKLCHVRLRW